MFRIIEFFFLVPVALIAIGFGACVHECAEPFSFWGSPTDDDKGLRRIWLYSLGFATVGLFICAGVAIMGSPILFYRYALGWPWEKSTLPGVLTAIGLIIALMVVAERK